MNKKTKDENQSASVLPDNDGLFSLENITDAAPGAVFCINTENEPEVIYANKFFYKLFNINENVFKQEYGNKFLKLIYPEDIENVKRAISGKKKSKKTSNIKARILKDGGEVHWLSINAGETTNDNVCICIAVDETESVNIILQSETARREIEGIANSTPGSISKILYKNGRISYNFLSNGIHNAAGYTVEDGVYHSLEAIIAPEDIAPMLESIEQQLEYSGFTVVFRIINKDGSYAWVRQNGSLIEVTENGEYVFVCVYIDIDNIRELQIETKKERERLKILLDSSGDILFEYNIANDTMRFIDRKMLEIGKSDDWYVYNYMNKTICDNTVHPGDIDLFLRVLSGGNITDNADIEIRLRCARNPSEYNWYAVKSVVMKDSGGNPDSVVGILSDIEQQKSAVLELVRGGKLDETTLLLNNENLGLEIDALLNKQKDGINNGYLLIEVDEFDNMFKNFGPLYTDKILKETAQLINDIFPSNCIAGRVGNGGFVILIPEISNEAYVVNLAGNLCESFAIEHRSTKLKQNATISIGIVYTPIDGVCFETLFSSAEAALERAKAIGGNCYSSYNTDMENSTFNPYTEFEGDNGFNTFNLTPNRTIITVLDILLSGIDVNGAINTVLDVIGKRFRINRILIYENIAIGDELQLTYEWSLNASVCPVRRINCKDSNGEMMLHTLNRRGLGIYDNIEYFSGCKSVYEDMQQHMVSKVMQLVTGFGAGIDSWLRFDFGEKTVLTGRDAKQLSNLIYLLSIYITKERKQEIVSSDNFFAQLVARQVGLFVYVIDTKTYEIKNMFRGIKNYRREAKVGQLCYKAIRGNNSPCDDCPLDFLSDTKKSCTATLIDSETNMQANVTVSRLKTMEDDYAIISYYDTSRHLNIMDEFSRQAAMPAFNRFRKEARAIINSNLAERFRITFIELISIDEIFETYGFVVGNKVISAIEQAYMKKSDKHSCYGYITSGKFVIMEKITQQMALTPYIKDYLDEFQSEVAEYLKDVLNPSYITFAAGIYDIKSNNEEITEAVEKAHMARKHILPDFESALESSQRFYVYDNVIAEKEMLSKLFASNMEKALKYGEFKVFLQPKFSLAANEFAGAEALVRWITPNNVTVYPTEFISFFEQNGFISKLDFYVYEQVFSHMENWLKMGIDLMPVSVNVSGAHINDIDFIDDLVNLIQKYNIPPHFVELEINEKDFIRHSKRSTSVFLRLSSIGFKIAVDDFGSELGSLTALTENAVSIIKIDKVFLEKSIEESGQKVIEGLVAFAKHLGIKTVCEGVETKEELEFIKSIKCDEAHGFFLAKPLPADMFDKFYMFDKKKMKNKKKGNDNGKN